MERKERDVTSSPVASVCSNKPLSLAVALIRQAPALPAAHLEWSTTHCVSVLTP